MHFSKTKYQNKCISSRILLTTFFSVLLIHIIRICKNKCNDKYVYITIHMYMNKV